jgi:putative tricarboxylic transport membrane protein
MEEIIIVSIFGFVTGICVGLIPAVGPFLTMVILYPLLVTFDPINIVLFYVTMLTAANFSGSVTGVLFGVPGETNAVVSAQLGFKYSARGHGSYALAMTALGSWLSTTFAVIILIYGIVFLSDQGWIYSSKVQAIVFFVVYLLMLTSFNAFIQLLLGSFLACIGYSTMWGETTIFGVSALAEGLSFLPVATAIVIIPFLYREVYVRDPNALPNISGRPANVMMVLKRFWKQRLAWLRSMFTGTFVGLIPGIGTVIVGNASYFIEKKFGNHSGRLLLSAESANNSSAVSSLIPLLCFGIPISLSEAMLVNILAETHSIVNLNWFSEENIATGLSNLGLIYIMLFLAGTVSLVLCWYLAGFLGKFVMTRLRVIFWAVIAVLLAAMVYAGIEENKLWLDLITFVILLPVGILFRRYNTQTLLLAFLLFATSSRQFYQFWQLIF